jgi:hypothetical protein
MDDLVALEMKFFFTEEEKEGFLLFPKEEKEGFLFFAERRERRITALLRS